MIDHLGEIGIGVVHVQCSFQAHRNSFGQNVQCIDEINGGFITRDLINNIYREVAQEDAHEYLHYSEKQNVSGDIIGFPRAAVIIEGHETHTRTGEIRLDLGIIPGIAPELIEAAAEHTARIPVTQAVIYGWYDNEMGSYVNMLGDRTVTIAEDL